MAKRRMPPSPLGPWSGSKKGAKLAKTMLIKSFKIGKAVIKASTKTRRKTGRYTNSARNTTTAKGTLGGYLVLFLVIGISLYLILK